jgi:hypothetical protein
MRGEQMMAKPDSGFKYADFTASIHSTVAFTVQGGIPNFIAPPRAAPPGASARNPEDPA